MPPRSDLFCDVETYCRCLLEDLVSVDDRVIDGPTLLIDACFLERWPWNIRRE